MAVYACSDLHGHMELYTQIKEYIHPEDVVYFLGDAGDRGPQCWETIKVVYNDKQFIYLKGNHETLLTEAMNDYLHPTGYSSNAYMILIQNGGLKTFDEWEEDGNSEEWIERLNSLPIYAKYQNPKGQVIYLSHAGFTPVWNGITNDTWLPEDIDLLWDREHFWDKWDMCNFPDSMVVHGHTPAHYIHRELGYRLDEYKLGAYWYCDKHKICIDCGTYVTKTACLLNLDTWEVSAQ